MAIDRKEKRRVILAIADLLDQCQTCEKKKQLCTGENMHKGHTQLQKYCITECDRGKQLRTFGLLLGEDKP